MTGGESEKSTSIRRRFTTSIKRVISRGSGKSVKRDSVISVDPSSSQTADASTVPALPAPAPATAYESPRYRGFDSLS